MIYIIFLERDYRRKQNIYLNILPYIRNYIVFSAFDYVKNDIKTFLKKHNMKVNCKLFRGQIACLISHYKIWINIVKNNRNDTIILEDDAVINSNFMNKVKEIKRELPIDYDLVYFFYNNKLKNEQYKEYKEEKLDKQFIRSAYPTYGTVGYMISNKCATKLLEHFKNVDSTVDDMLAKMLVSGKIKTFFSKNILVKTIGDISDKDKSLLPSNIWNTGYF